MQPNELNNKGARWLLDWKMILAGGLMLQAFVILAGHCPNGRHFKPSVSTCATRWYLDSSDRQKPASTSSRRRDGGCGGVSWGGGLTPYSLPCPARGGQNWPLSESQANRAPLRTGTVIITNEGYVFNREHTPDGKSRFHPSECLEGGPFG